MLCQVLTEQVLRAKARVAVVDWVNVVGLNVLNAPAPNSLTVPCRTPIVPLNGAWEGGMVAVAAGGAVEAEAVVACDQVNSSP
jgi:hypothetical protein